MMETILFLTALVVTLNLNGSYAAPTNMTIAEEEFSYCTENVTSCRVTITELYDATDDVLNVFDDLCNETLVRMSSEHMLMQRLPFLKGCGQLTQYTVQSETNRTIINDRINGELEKLIGRLKGLDEVCKDEEDKLFNGEGSLTDECNMLKCSIEPIPHKIAQYVSSMLTILMQS